jgi:hypothetical protein
MRRLHLSIAWGVIVASSLWIAGQIGWTRDSLLTFFFAFLVPACVTAGLVVLWRRGERDIRPSHYRPSTLHSRRRGR